VVVRFMLIRHFLADKLSLVGMKLVSVHIKNCNTSCYLNNYYLITHLRTYHFCIISQVPSVSAGLRWVLLMLQHYAHSWDRPTDWTRIFFCIHMCGMLKCHFCISVFLVFTWNSFTCYRCSCAGPTWKVDQLNKSVLGGLSIYHPVANFP